MLSESYDNRFEIIANLFYTEPYGKGYDSRLAQKRLTKDGWALTAEFLQIEYEELEIFADLVAEREPIIAEK